MAELIAIIVLGLSLAGAFFIVGRKIPVLLELQSAPKDRPTGFWERILKNVESYLQKIPIFKGFSWQAWIEKSLSKARVMALKTDNKIEGYLTALHVKEEEKKKAGGHTTGEYWSDVKEFVKTKTGLHVKPIQPRQESDSARQAQDEPVQAGTKKEEAVPLQFLAPKGKDRKKKNKKRFARKGGNW